MQFTCKLGQSGPLCISQVKWLLMSHNLCHQVSKNRPALSSKQTENTSEVSIAFLCWYFHKHELGTNSLACGGVWKNLHYHFFTLLFTTVLSNGISPTGNLGCLCWGKLAATESCDPTCSKCWMFSMFIIHWTPTWTMGSLTWTQMLMHEECTQGCTDTIRESALKFWLWEKHPLLHKRIQSVLAACQSDALPTELHPHPCKVSDKNHTWNNGCCFKFSGRWPEISHGNTWP